MIIHALAIFLFLPNFIHGQVKTCASRQYSSSTVCVCNSTYCDEFPPLGQLADGQAAVYTSSKSGKRFERTTLNFGSDQAQSPIQFTVDISKQAQKIIGFGGAITDSAVINFFNLSAAAQTNLINAYYGDAGIGYTVGRMPIAASDFTDREYNYANVSGDFNLTNFALAYEDFQFRIPFIKMAQALIGSKLKLFGSPWGPPGWLKTSGLQHGCASLIGNLGDMYYQTWANYFIRGFVKLNLGPTIRNNEVTKKLKIMIFDTSRSLMPNYPNDILKDPETSKYVDGIGIHWYHDTQNIHAPTSPSVITEVHDANPDKFLMVTEACAGWFGYEGRHGVDLGNWSRGERYAQDAIENLNYWGSGWTDWNMILDTQGGPSWVGNKADSPIIVNATSDEFYKQPMFYALGHLSKFLVENSTKVQLDAQGIDVSSNTSLMDAVALITPSNQRVLVINNRASSNYSIAIKDTSIPGSQLALNIESNSMTTFIWSGCGCPSTGNWFPSRTNPCNCYSLVQTPSNWISANNYCQQQDPKATLASIDSAFENSALLGSLQNQTSCSQAFIGLKQQNNAWTWINNDPSTYRNWRAGYPISNTNDKYVQLNTKDGAWTNIDNTVSGCYLCEVKTSV